MQLSLRLSAIADLVTEGNRLVDVGCDHGYLPVYLIQQKKIPSAIAMDVRKGPLSRAQGTYPAVWTGGIHTDPALRRT
ncbi:MAG: tRNA (adenine(22)-N(1))-methyltransferase TrmK [Ruminococcus sp.]